MKLSVKPAAITELKKHQLKENEGIRIKAVFVGNCSLYVDHSLQLDERRNNDDVFTIEGIPFLLSKESQKYLFHQISLDFNPLLGFKLSSSEETYRYNLKLERV